MPTDISHFSEASRLSHLEKLSIAIQEGTCRARHYLVLSREDRKRLIGKLGILSFNWELIKTKMTKEMNGHVQTEIQTMVKEITASQSLEEREKIDAILKSKITYFQKEIDAENSSVSEKKEKDIRSSQSSSILKNMGGEAKQKIKDHDLIVFFEALNYIPLSTRKALLEQGDNDTRKAALIRMWMADHSDLLEEITQFLGIRLGIKTFPPEICLLTNLKILMLTHNEFDSLPSDIGKLSKLETLCLFQNKLKSIPPEIGQLNKVQKLVLSNNQLETLPKELVQLSSLKAINLKGNPLKSLPIEIRQLKKFPKISI